MKSLPFFIPVLALAISLSAQPPNCSFSKPAISIDFGSGNGSDITVVPLPNYQRVTGSCPTDGHYSYASGTSHCFSDDWHTLAEDHTPGDADGNMLLVNGAYHPGVFLQTTIAGLEGGAIYELGLWLMNLCKPTYKCPFPLLPNFSIRLETVTGKFVARFSIGDLPRTPSPHWTHYAGRFAMPASVTALVLTMTNNAPGGCGNDFALDDITFRECIKTNAKEVTPKKPVTKTAPPKPSPPKTVPSHPTSSKRTPPKTATPKTGISKTSTPKIVPPQRTPTIPTSPAPVAVAKQPPPIARPAFPPQPLTLTTRENFLVKRIETDSGQIKIELYDNGEIDGDTVSIYHNNSLIKSHAGLSGDPITFTIRIDKEQPHHELIMVADNLGSIPPNTSVMIISAGGRRYEVFISSTEQKNAKVILDLKQ